MQHPQRRPLHEEDSNDDNNDGMIRGYALNTSSPSSNEQQHDTTTKTSHELEARTIASALKPMPNFDGDPELRSLAITIRRDIVQESPRVHWNDIIGLDDAKRLLQETIILPRKYPELFTGIRSPWKSVLLYGMPGTGKTLLAKAVATEGNSTFFNISASSIVSKYRGDSEKLIRMLFVLARHYSPSTIFIDEADSIMCHRGGGGGGSFGSSMNEGSSEHEGSRRMKTELLIQMDGLLSSAANSNSGGVFVLAASNLPWDLDPAFLRRMEKRILIPLPNAECRKEIISSQLSPFSSIFSNGAFLDSAASLVDGYSGSDLKVLCKEVAMRPLRRILNDPSLKSEGSTTTTDGSVNISLLMKRNPITAQDFHDAIATVSHSTSAALCDRYRKWMDAHGSSC
jgi:katanin p60 ATPase-containing subunit A1